MYASTVDLESSSLRICTPIAVGLPYSTSHAGSSTYWVTRCESPIEFLLPGNYHTTLAFVLRTGDAFESFPLSPLVDETPDRACETEASRPRTRHNSANSHIASTLTPISHSDRTVYPNLSISQACIQGARKQRA